MRRSKNKKREEPNDSFIDELPKERIIYGAFIKCKRVINNEISDEFMIKLSSINQIYDLKQGSSVFYTYKDCMYIARISSDELTRAINLFIFEPEIHWESYSA